MHQLQFQCKVVGIYVQISPPCPVHASRAAFSCLGCGGNGAVFEVIPLESAYTDRRLFPTVRRAGPVLAMKQIYKDAATAEQVWQREVKEQLDLTFKLLRDESTADENAHALSTLALTLDGFKEGPDEHGKCLVRIIMFRARE